MTDYEFMLSTLGQVLQDEVVLKRITAEYLSDPQAIENVRTLLIH